MEEDLIPQRKQIDISKNQHNTLDYYNDSYWGNEDFLDNAVYPDEYVNNNPPACSPCPKWPEYMDDINELKLCIDYISCTESYKKWIYINTDWGLTFKEAKELFNKISNNLQNDITQISKFSKITKYYLSELNKIIDEISKLEQVSSKKQVISKKQVPENINSPKKNNKYFPVFWILLILLVIPYPFKIYFIILFLLIYFTILK